MSGPSNPDISPLSEYHSGVQQCGSNGLALPEHTPTMRSFPQPNGQQQQARAASTQMAHPTLADSIVYLDPAAMTQQTPADVAPLQEFTGLLSFPTFSGPSASPSPGRYPPMPSLSPPGQETSNHRDQLTKHPSPKAPHSPYFTRTPLPPRPQPPDPSPLQAPSRRNRKAKERSIPYKATTVVKYLQEMTPADDLDAWYTSLVDEAMQDPANRFYRREVIEKAIRGTDYCPKSSARRLRAGRSSRPNREVNWKTDTNPPRVAKASHILPLTPGHDHKELPPQQQVSEGVSLVHRPRQLRIADNQGHLVHGIPAGDAALAANSVPLVPSVPPANSEGLECNTPGFVQRERSDPAFSSHNHIDQCDEAYMCPPNPSEPVLHSRVEPNLFPTNAMGSWQDPAFDLFESAYGFPLDIPYGNWV